MIKVCISMDKELKELIKQFSEKKHISQNAIIRLAIIEYIERNK